MIPPIIIAGSGRSGTTWILDAIAEANNLSTVFEPLHPVAVPDAKQFACRYLRENDIEPCLYEFMLKVFAGKFKNIWANYRIRPDRLSVSKVRQSRENWVKYLLKEYVKLYNNFNEFGGKLNFPLIVKFIRANLMLSWLANNFNAKVILVLRHPCAVIASRIPLMGRIRGKSWGLKHDLDIYLNDDRLIEEHLQPHMSFITNPSLNRIQKLTILWCIENRIPLTNEHISDYCIVYYEDLLTDSDNTWRRILSEIGLDKMPSEKSLIKPSQQAPTDMANRLYDSKQLSRWSGSFNTEQLDQIDYILQLFQVDIYNVHSPLPVKMTQGSSHLL